MLTDDDITLVTCPVCQGHGRQEMRTTDIDGREHFISNECYLCGGRGACDATLIAMWHDAGRPQARLM